jgi:hypothetical protein
MIAYLFWHCDYPTTTAEQYEEALMRFQQRLGQQWSALAIERVRIDAGNWCSRTALKKGLKICRKAPISREQTRSTGMDLWFVLVVLALR